MSCKTCLLYYFYYTYICNMVKMKSHVNYYLRVAVSPIMCMRAQAEYVKLGAVYLTSSEDTITHYEQAARRAVSGRTSREQSVERELRALDSVDRVTRVEMVAGGWTG